MENVIFAHTKFNVLQLIQYFFEYFQQKISKNTDKSVQLEALKFCLHSSQVKLT